MPNVSQLAHHCRVCLTESEEVPPDWTTLYQTKRKCCNFVQVIKPYTLFDAVYSLDTTLVPKILESYNLVGVKHEPLKLIPPQFETPLPALQVPPYSSLLAEITIKIDFEHSDFRVSTAVSHCWTSALGTLRLGRRVQLGA